MPAVPSGSLVLVTGASGFIAVHVVTELINKGYRVRGTVRSKDKGEFLVRKFPKNFEYVLVEDLEDANGFDEAVKGVDAVEHTASPFHFNVSDPHKDLINPAVNGTLSVLKSVQKNASDTVKRIVITSSFASILDSSVPSPHTFTEKDWNEYSTVQVEQKGKDTPPAESYRASKTLAERAAWKFVEENKPKWDLVTMCPPLVLGPIIHQISSAKSLNTSVSAWYAWLSGSKDGDKAPGDGASNEVDVRDLALAHVQAIVLEEAGNNRFAIANGPHTWQIALDEVYGNPDLQKSWPKLPQGKPGADKLENLTVLDASKSKKVLGINYRSFKTTLLDMSASLAEHEASGWKMNA